MIPSQSSERWIWLFPLAQILHALEEYVQGYDFHVWLRGVSHADYSSPQTLSMHLGFIAAVTLAAWIAVRFDRVRWMIVALGVLVLLNAASHAVGAFVSPQAASGLFTSIGVWIPLGTAAVLKGWRDLSRGSFAVGVAVGVLVQIPLTWLAAVAG